MPSIVEDKNKTFIFAQYYICMNIQKSNRSKHEKT